MLVVVLALGGSEEWVVLYQCACGVDSCGSGGCVVEPCGFGETKQPMGRHGEEETLRLSMDRVYVVTSLCRSAVLLELMRLRSSVLGDSDGNLKLVVMHVAGARQGWMIASSFFVLSLWVLFPMLLNRAYVLHTHYHIFGLLPSRSKRAGNCLCECILVVLGCSYSLLDLKHISPG